MNFKSVLSILDFFVKNKNFKFYMQLSIFLFYLQLLDF